MKICFFSPASYPFFSESKDHTSGGAEFQFFLLANSLSINSEFNVSFLVGEYSQNDIIKSGNVTLYKSFDIKAVDSVFKKIRNTIKYFFFLKRIKPDIVITTTANSIVGVTAFFKRFLKYKHLHRTAHQDDVDKSWIQNNGLTGKIYNYGLRKADKIVTQSKEHQVLLMKNHRINAKILKNAFDVKKFISPKKQGVLWVGRYEEWKNPFLYLELAKDNTSVMFRMICPYSIQHKKQRNRLKSEAEKLKNLEFIEKVPFHDIQTYFDNAQLFVNTSSQEGFPNTYLQSAQAITPILSLNVDPDGFINNFECGISCSNDSDKMKTHFKRLIEDRDELRRLGKNNFKYLKENHDIKDLIKDFESIILTLHHES